MTLAIPIAGVLLFDGLRSKTFEAEAQLKLTTASSVDDLSSFSQQVLIEPVLEPVARTASVKTQRPLAEEIRNVQQHGRVQVHEDEGILSIFFRDEDPVRSQWLTNEVSQALIAYLRDIKASGRQAEQSALRAQIQEIQRQVVFLEDDLERYRKQGLHQGLLGQWIRKMDSFHVQRTALRNSYSAGHPAVLKLDQKIRDLELQIRDYHRDEMLFAEASQKKKDYEQQYRQLLQELQTSKLEVHAIPSDLQVFREARRPGAPLEGPSKSSLLGAAILLGLIPGLLSLRH